MTMRSINATTKTTLVTKFKYDKGIWVWRENRECDWMMKGNELFEYNKHRVEENKMSLMEKQRNSKGS